MNVVGAILLEALSFGPSSSQYGRRVVAVRVVLWFALLGAFLFAFHSEAPRMWIIVICSVFGAAFVSARILK